MLTAQRFVHIQIFLPIFLHKFHAASVIAYELDVQIFTKQ